MVKLDSQLLPSFLAVADCLNFTEAARKIGATQSGLSQHISKLEETLGVPLFIRTNKKVLLTETGVTFKNYAQKYLEDESKLFEKILGEKAKLQGLVKYAMPESCLLSPHLTQLLIQREKEFNEIKLEIKVANHFDILHCVLEHEVDFGFSTQKELTPGLTFTPYCMEEYVLVGHKSFQKKINNLEDLFEVPFILHEGFTDVVNYWWEKQKPKKAMPDLNIVAKINHFQGVKTLLLNRVGVSILPKQCIKEELSKNHIMTFLDDLKSISNQIYIVTLTNASLSDRVRHIINEFHKMIPS